MTELRRGYFESAIQEQLPEGRAQKVGAAHHFGDAHGGVIHHDCELIGRDVVFAPYDEIAEVDARDRALRPGRSIKKLQGFALGNAKAPGHARGILGSNNRQVSGPAGARVERLLILGMGRAGCVQHIATRAIAGIDQAAVAQFLPRGEIERTAFTLQKRSVVPLQTEPAQIFANRLPKPWPAARAIEIFHAQNECAVARPAALLRTPKSDRVAGVQVTGRRWRKATAIGKFGLQIADFRLPEALFNLKSSFLKSSFPKRLLLFDIDGTLINSAGAGLQALRDVLQEQFGITDNLEGIEVAGRTDSGIVHQIFRKQKIEPNEKNTARFLDQYLELLAEELPQRPGFVLPGVKELLLRLRERSRIVLALLTGNVERGAKLKLEHYGLWQFFEFGAFADDHHDRNELGAFARRRARERHGVEFESAAIDVIGDTPHDIACGKAIGARTVVVATGSFTREQLARHQPDWILDDFSNVAAVLAELGW